MGFEKALIRVEREQEFQQLRESVERVLAPGSTEKFLKRLASDGVRIRDFERVLERNALDRVDDALRRSGRTGSELYRTLTPSDQGQMREFYLLKLETVDVALRHKFKKLFQYY